MKVLPADISIRDFLAALASPDEAHGAVSAAAVSGGLGAALLYVVSSLPQARSHSIQDRAKLTEAAAVLEDVRAQLLETMETETAVRIFTARNLPQANSAERLERQVAIQIALRAAADVPLEVMRLCVRGLKEAEKLAAHSVRAASADVQLGIALLCAAFDGARSTLEAKLGSLTDTQFTRSVIDEIASLSEEAATAAQAAKDALQVPAA